MSDYKIQPLSDHVSPFGESSFWDDQIQSLVYADCFAKSVCSFDLRTQKTSVIPVDTSAEFILAVTPCASTNANDFLVVSKNQMLKVNANSTKLLYEANKGPNFLFQIGNCDAMGRLWIGGTNIVSDDPLEVGPEKGQLYCYTQETGDPTPHSFDYDIPAGLAWNANYSKLYSADGFRKTVNVFDFDVTTGALGPQSVFFDFTTTTHPELRKLGRKNYPDGLAMDLNGNLWIVNWENGMVIKIDGTTGTVLDIVHMPITHITSLVFGGPTHQFLLVTSTSLDLKMNKCQEGNPDAGKVHRITNEKDNTFRGFKMNRFGSTRL